MSESVQNNRNGGVFSIMQAIGSSIAFSGKTSATSAFRSSWAVTWRWHAVRDAVIAATGATSLKLLDRRFSRSI
jgi:hypothetical protein